MIKRIPWGAILRGLRRYNVVLLSVLGTLLVLAPVGVGVTYLLDHSTPRTDSVQVTAQTEEQGEEAQTLRLEIVREFSAPAHLLGALIEENPGRGALYMTRNLVLYDLSTGIGRRVFPNDDGHVGRYAPVTATCVTTRSLSPPRAAPANPVAVETQAAAPLPEAIGVIALWREQGESQWRLGVFSVRTGEWRELAAEVANLETLVAAPGNSCRAIVRRADGLHAVTFAFNGNGEPVDVLLALE